MISAISAAALLPHQPPMRLIDEVVAWDERQICAIAGTATSTYTDTNGLPSCFGLELMAQASAAFFTLQAGADATPRQGMLIASRKFRTELAHYPLHGKLLIHARLNSALPPDANKPALVKFAARIALFESKDSIPDATEQFLSFEGLPIVSEADLSVYL